MPSCLAVQLTSSEMDYNFQRDVEMLRRLVNGLPFGHSSYFPQLFNETYYGFQDIFEDPLFEPLFMEHSGRSRMNTNRHARNFARNLVLLEQLLNSQVSQLRREHPNSRHRSRINITLQQPPVSQIPTRHIQTEPSASNDTNSVCESIETGGSDIEICTICREKFKERDNIRQLPCEHLFHPECLRPWLQRRNTCPTCRRHL